MIPLTGKFAFRKTFRGKTVLRVEEEAKPFWRRSKSKPRWHDATLIDVAARRCATSSDAGLKPCGLEERAERVRFPV